MTIQKLGLFSLAVAISAFTACGSDSTTPTASGVFPAQGFTGRQLRVEISGDATKWKDGTTVSFGDGVTVNMVEVASPTDLFADITIDPAAMAGLRDVTVTGGGTFKLSQAFELVAPVELQITGNAGQGGLPYFTFVNHDVENPFDLTTDANTGAYTNLVITGPTGADFEISAASEFEISGRVFIDTTATAGAVSIASGPASATVTSAAGTFNVMARTPVALVAGTPATGMLMTSGDSVLYSMTSTGSSLAHISMSSTDANAQPAGAIFPDGTWAGAAGLHYLMPSGGTVDAIVADLGTEAPYSFTVSGGAEALTSAPEGTDGTDGTNGGALNATMIPFEQTGGTMSSAADVDEIKFVVAAGDANRSIELVTDAGSDPNTDTQVDIVDAGGASYLQAYGGGPVNGTECAFGAGNCGFETTDNMGEDVVSDPLPAGTYYIKISVPSVAAGSQYTTNDKDYTALFWLQ